MTFFFLWPDSRGKGNKSKNKQIGLYQTTELLLSEGNYHQTEKATPLMGEDACKLNHVSDKELISKVLKKSHNSSTRNKEPNLKMGRRHEYILPKKTYR